MQYDLHHLNGLEFQRLVNALAEEAFGPNSEAPGLGPDGGADGRFVGQSLYQSHGARWNGEIVVQAKAKVGPKTTTATGGKWALSELSKELKRIRAGALMCDFYLFVVNVELSPVPKLGAMDNARSLIAELVSDRKLRGGDVWDYNKLNSLLSANADVRRAFRGLITTGDVLAGLLESVSGRQVALVDEIRANVASELVGGESFCRLTEAGSTRVGVHLADVIVDLPSQAILHDRSLSRTEEGGRPSANLLRFLIERLNKVDSTSRTAASSTGSRQAPEGQVRLDRILIVGGPGQGKSSLSQFLCQVYRVHALDQFGADMLPEIAEEVERVLSAVQRLKLPAIGKSRIPFRVELKAFADWVSKGATRTLIGWLGLSVGMDPSSHNANADIREVFRNGRWLLVLDGLDEVPRSANRNSVIDAIGAFSMLARSMGFDVVILVTTRPQGYSGELDSGTYDKIRLVELDVQTAVECATFHLNVAEPDVVRRNALVTRFNAGLTDGSLAAIAVTPLQVTMLTILMSTQGEVPDDRWMLFDEYYRIIYRRETERGTDVSPLLRKYSHEVRRIHEECGLHLQLLTEREGSANAGLGRGQLEIIVRHILHLRMGSDCEALSEEVEQLVVGCLERLVFLHSPSDGAVGFGVRSLQEFMAASALAATPDDSLVEIVRDFSAIPYWTNVFMFLAVAVARQKPYLVASVVEAVNFQLTKEALDDYFTSSGAALAVRLLHEPAFFGYARLAAQLSNAVVSANARWDFDVLQLIPDASRKSTALAAGIRENWDRLARSLEPHSAISLLAKLGGIGETWAIDELAEKHLPHDQGFALFAHLGNREGYQKWELSLVAKRLSGCRLNEISSQRFMSALAMVPREALSTEARLWRFAGRTHRVKRSQRVTFGGVHIGDLTGRSSKRIPLLCNAQFAPKWIWGRILTIGQAMDSGPDRDTLERFVAAVNDLFYRSHCTEAERHEWARLGFSYLPVVSSWLLMSAANSRDAALEVDDCWSQVGTGEGVEALWSYDYGDVVELKMLEGLGSSAAHIRSRVSAYSWSSLSHQPIADSLLAIELVAFSQLESAFLGHRVLPPVSPEVLDNLAQRENTERVIESVAGNPYGWLAILLPDHSPPIGLVNAICQATGKVDQILPTGERALRRYVHEPHQRYVELLVSLIGQYPQHYSGLAVIFAACIHRLDDFEWLKVNRGRLSDEASVDSRVADFQIGVAAMDFGLESALERVDGLVVCFESARQAGDRILTPFVNWDSPNDVIVGVARRFAELSLQLEEPPSALPQRILSRIRDRRVSSLSNPTYRNDLGVLQSMRKDSSSVRK